MSRVTNTLKRAESVSRKARSVFAGQKAEPESAIASLYDQISKLQHARLVGPKLEITLHKDYMFFGQALSDIAADADVTRNIVFRDRDRLRQYADVWFDVERRAPELARAAYRSPGNRFVISTPALLGRDPETGEILCRPVRFEGRDGVVTLQTRLVGSSAGYSEELFGTRRIIQSGRVRLTARDGNWHDLILHIEMRPALWQPLPARISAPVPGRPAP